MGFLEGVKDLLKPDLSHIERYYEAWFDFAPTIGLKPLRDVPDSIKEVLSLSDYLGADSREFRFIGRREISGLVLYTFYYIRHFNVMTLEDEVADSWLGIVEYPFKGGRIVLRYQRNKKLKDTGPGLNFEHREFSEDTWVMAEPEVIAYQFFHPRMIEHFNPFYEYQFEALPGYFILTKYMLWERMTYEVYNEPNYDFKRQRAFNNAAKKFFPKMIELVPSSLSDL